MGDEFVDQDRPLVEALGELTVQSHARGRSRLVGVEAALLLRLLFARGQFVSAESIKGFLPRGGDESAVHTHASKLKKTLREHGVTLPRSRSGGYRLPDGLLRLDAQEFPGLVEALGEPADPAEAARLLAMWRADPRRVHALVDDRHWNTALKSRDQLVAKVTDLFRRGVEVEGWGAFADRFDDDPAVKTADALHPGKQRALRRRLLIVEDDEDVCRELRSLLSAFDTTAVHSISAFDQLMAGDPPRFDGALVDRHLTDRNDDRYGYSALEVLQKRGIPRVLITAYFPGGEARQTYETLTERYGLAAICVKSRPGVGGLDASAVRKAVNRMMGLD